VRSLQWGADATKLFGSDAFNGLDALTVNAGGVSLIQSFNGVANGDRIHFSQTNSQIYGEGGEVLSTAGQTTANFNVRGPMVIDPGLNAAFIIPQNFFGSSTLQAYNLSRFTLNRTITLNGVTGTPRRMIHWGQNGLAFNTDSGQIILVAGNFLDPIAAPPALPVPTPTPTPTPNPNPQAPAISFLNPGSAIVGDNSFTLTVQGTNFTNSSLTTDISYPLGSDFFGPFFALDLQVAPGAPHTSAVSRGIRGSSPSALGGIEIFDDATPRPVIAKGFGPGGGGGVIYDS
jgi:hypothetical protein